MEEAKLGDMVPVERRAEAKMLGCELFLFPRFDRGNGPKPRRAWIRRRAAGKGRPDRSQTNRQVLRSGAAGFARHR